MNEPGRAFRRNLVHCTAVAAFLASCSLPAVLTFLRQGYEKPRILASPTAPA